MANKELLFLNLNYAHRNLSPGSRLNALIFGMVFLGVGAISLMVAEKIMVLYALNSGLNLLAGIILISFSSRRLTWFMQKYINVTDDSVRLKLNTLFPRKKFNWNDIEQLELSHESLKVWSEKVTKPMSISLRSVSYDDYQVFYKLMVDICLEKNIDMV